MPRKSTKVIDLVQDVDGVYVESTELVAKEQKPQETINDFFDGFEAGQKFFKDVFKILGR